MISLRASKMVAEAASVIGQFFLEKDGRKNDFGPFDANVFSWMEHGRNSGRVKCIGGAW